MPPSASFEPARNRMAEASSPYLLQHAENPVHWQPWGDDAFAIALARDVPVLLSVGYAACHWCHVMAHESFEDPEVAGVMNANFVCIKVDREERPDVDAVYMAATQALNQGRGGWPMTVWLTPDRKPFFAGTYFPPTAKHGMPGFRDLLAQVADLWRTRREDFHGQAAEVTRAITPTLAPTSAPVPESTQVQRLLQTALSTLARRFDAAWGGFTAAPKFPHSEILRLGLALSDRFPEFADQVRFTLGEMARGGLHDMVGGGFSRYSVDAAWHVPHFEKMLYDNALLASTYAEAAMCWDDAGLRAVACRTVDFALRELTDSQGRFYASLDADSEGHEGKFYVWTHSDALAVLNQHLPHGDSLAALAALEVTLDGNWEHGVSIPRLRDDPLGPRAGDDPHHVRAACAWLFAARAARVRPATDTKVLTGHNGLMGSALAAVGRATSELAYVEAGVRALDAVWHSAMQADGTLWRTPNNPAAPIVGVLEDYAYLATGLLDLYEAGGPSRCVVRSAQLGRRMLSHFADAASGALFDTAHDHERLLFRPRESHDGATPSAAATAAHVLLRLGVHTGDGALTSGGLAALGAMQPELAGSPHAHCRALLALDFHHAVPQQGVWVGGPGVLGPDALFAELAKTFRPHRVLAHGLMDAEGDVAPLLAHRHAPPGASCVYLCEHYTCGSPIADVAALRQVGAQPT